MEETLKGTMGHMPKRMLPSFSLSQEDLPAIKKWTVGKKYTLEIEVEQVSMEKDEYMPGKPMMARFRIVKVKESEKYTEEKKKDEMGKMGH